MKLYLAGPMTGYEHYNAAAFRDWSRVLKQLGHDVVTPFDTNSVVWQQEYGRDFDPMTDRCDYGDPLLKRMMLEDFTALLGADAVVVLPGWWRSKGATAETLVAQNAGIPVLDVATLEPVQARVRAIVDVTGERADAA